MTITTSDIVFWIVLSAIVFAVGCAISFMFGTAYRKSYGEIKFIEGYFGAQDKMRRGIYIDPYNENKDITSIGSTSKGLWLDKGENIYSLCDAKTEKLAMRDDGTSYKLSATLTKSKNAFADCEYLWRKVKRILGAGEDCKSIYIEYRTTE